MGEQLSAAEKETEDARKIAELKESITALLDNMPAISFSKDAESGVYLACNQAFANYAQKASPGNVAGLTDNDLFDAETAAHFVEKDRQAMAMDMPYIFMEDVTDGAGKQRHLQTTKLKYKDTAGRLCLLGMCVDVTDTERIRIAEERMEEERIACARINALAGDYLSIHIVDPESERYKIYSTNMQFDSFSLPTEGTDFFNTTRALSRTLVHPEDLEHYMESFTRENVIREIENTGMYTLSYRLMVEGKPVHVQLKASVVEEKEGRRLIFGINNVDAQFRQEEEYRKRLTQAQQKASIDALTGIKNKHAYLDAEEALNWRIAEGDHPAFAVTVLDINDLKTINDTEGHQAGDQFIRDACRIVCTTFRHSPVFRVGGDEFAMISQGSDLERINELQGIIADLNRQALKSGGIVLACGSARFEKGRDGCVASVFERADQIMYENKTLLKNSGRA